MVPNIKAADTMRFHEFMDAFDDLIARARKGKLEIDDFQNTTISLTNPGTIGTVSSMPRLMKGQGAIIATGAMNYPRRISGNVSGSAQPPGNQQSHDYDLHL